MTDRQVIESLDNAWRALEKRYGKYPDNGIRHGMNLLAKIIGQVKSEVEKSHEERQITIEEWMEMLQKENGNK